MQAANGVSLDYVQDPGPISPQHDAFLVSEAEFDEILGRVRARGLPYSADPMKTRPGEINATTAAAGSTSPILPDTSSRSSPGRTDRARRSERPREKTAQSAQPHYSAGLAASPSNSNSWSRGAEERRITPE